MLIYNYKKEFIGIDEKDLKILGLENLSQLYAEASDFADLFLKSPGYVHNFKHVHWIDYIVCADSTEQPKVIINVNNNLYKADLTIATAYLADSPTQKGYMINLNHLRILTTDEKNHISADSLEMQATKPAGTVTPTSFDVVTPQEAPEQPVLEDEYDVAFTEPSAQEQQPLEIETTVIDEYDEHLPIDIEIPTETIPKESEIESLEETPLEMPEVFDIPETIEVEKESQTPTAVLEEALITPAPHLDLDQDILDALNSGYVYNPQIASDELGLPLDLIEEFIEDFINQAKEFKEDLYNALEEGDIDNVKVLSHKLKGVAANLRIEDAFEVLSTINTTSDLEVIKKNLDIFYILVKKLSGEEINLENPIDKHEEEELILDFKDEIPMQITDNDVPDEIELPELADDNFVAQEEISLEVPEEVQHLDLLVDEEIIAPSPIVENVYSKTAIADTIGVDIETLEELITDFYDESRELIKSMENSLANEELNQLKAQAVQLKGMSDNLGFSNLSAGVEDLLNSDSLDQASNTLKNIENILDQISIED